MVGFIFLLFFLCLIFFLVSCLFLKYEPMSEMKSSFESGMDQLNSNNPPFYLHFIYIGVIFLVFDIEIILCIPMLLGSIDDVKWTIYWTLFFQLIFVGLVMETFMNSLEWKE